MLGCYVQIGEIVWRLGRSSDGRVGHSRSGRSSGCWGNHLRFSRLTEVG